MIRTARCSLTGLQSTDLEPLVRLHLDPDVMHYLGGPREEGAIREHLANLLETGSKNPIWAVRLTQDDVFMGIITLTPHHDGEDTEISYLFLPEWWGKGYATEAVQVILNHGLTKLGQPRIIAETQTANKASLRLLERLGMEFERKVERFDAEQSIYTTI
ncbi:MAG: GNAT family N-acetyltransferase [Chloroflexota bacterium]